MGVAYCSVVYGREPTACICMCMLSVVLMITEHPVLSVVLMITEHPVLSVSYKQTSSDLQMTAFTVVRIPHSEPHTCVHYTVNEG